MDKNKIIELKTYQLLKKGLLILAIIEILIFFSYGIRFLGYFLKSAFSISFIIINIALIIGLYLYFSYREKQIKKELRQDS